MNQVRNDNQQLENLQINEQNDIFESDNLSTPEDNIEKVQNAPVGSDSPTTTILPGLEWGYIDDNGDIYLNNGKFFPTHKIGDVRGDTEKSLAYFIERFQQYDAFVTEVESEVQAAENKVFLQRKVNRLLKEAPDQNVLGDLDSVIQRLQKLEAEITQQVEERQQQKQTICDEAAELRLSDQWKTTHQRIQELRKKLIAIGPAGKERDDQYWKDFNAYADEFYQRRKQHFEQLEREYQQNAEIKSNICTQAATWAESSDYAAAGRAMKELWDTWRATGHAGRDQEHQLWESFNASRRKFYANRKEWWKDNFPKKKDLVTQAESLSTSTDWRVTSQALKQLMDEWREVGSAGPEADDELWSRFQQARQIFFERQSEYFGQRDRERQQNVEQKEALIKEAKFARTLDPRQGKDRIKELQLAWKETGHVPRQQADELWQQFRSACDAVYEQANRTWKNRQEAEMVRRIGLIRDIEEQISHDQSNIDRWQSTIADLTPGGRSIEIEASLREKIHDVSARIEMKRGWINEHQAVIDDISERLVSNE